MYLAGLFIYPVKSLGGFAAKFAEVDALGLVGDRRFMLVDGEGRFLTQRVLPRMALVAASLTPEALCLREKGGGSVTVRRTSEGEGASRPTRKVTVWQAEGLTAEDCGEEAAGWLGSFLGVDCRLVRIGPDFSRPIPAHKLPVTWEGDAGEPGRPGPTGGLGGTIGSTPLVSFADAYPVLAIGEASLEDLNDRLAERGEDPVPMNRFRPNLVIADTAPFAEDTWKRIRIGAVTFHAAGHSARCIVTCTEQSTAERGVEPLRTLADYRRDAIKPSNVNFGENLINETKSGVLRVGDPVEVLT